MSRLTKKEKEALDARGYTIGLDPVISCECITEEQQDILLKLQERVEMMKIAYEVMKKRTVNKPTRDYDAAMQKLKDLIEYTWATYDLDSYLLLEQIELQKHRPYAKQKRDEFKNEATTKMKEHISSTTRREKLLAELMKYYDEHEPSEEIHTKINKFLNNPQRDPENPPKLKYNGPFIENDNSLF